MCPAEWCGTDTYRKVYRPERMSAIKTSGQAGTVDEVIDGIPVRRGLALMRERKLHRLVRARRAEVKRFEKQEIQVLRHQVNRGSEYAQHLASIP